MKSNQKGFSALGILLVIVIVGLLGAVGWLVYDRQKDKDNEQSVTQISREQNNETQPDPNEEYLVVKEWGLRFKVPSNLTDVKYRVFGDIVAFYAKPTAHTVEYRSDYEKPNDIGHPRYAIGTLYRSNERHKEGGAIEPVEGKKVGDYYYYTGHSFSSLSTGAGCVGLYGDGESSCEPESKVFQAVNQGETALLNTIELAQ